MPEEIVSFNEDMLGNPEFDQQILLEGEEESAEIYMSRPFKSLYDFEKGIVNLALCEYEDYLIEHLDPEAPDYQQIYR